MLLLTVLAACALLAVPAGEAHVVVLRVDASGDRHCSEQESVAVPGPVHEHALAACLILA
jgi:hypothetical protein